MGKHPRNMTIPNPERAREEAERDAEAAWRKWFMADERVGGTSEAFIAGFLAGEGWPAADPEREQPMSAELDDEEIERIVEPIYEAYRLGKYGKQEYLPMWHELEDKPTRTLEATVVIGAVTSIVAAHVRRALEDAANAYDGNDTAQVSYRCIAQDLRDRANADPRETKD